MADTKTAELMTVEDYAGFIGVHPRVIRRWVAAGFCHRADLELDGHLFRLGASLSLIPRVSTPIAARIFMAELELTEAKIAQKTAAFKAWAESVRAATVTMRTMALGWHLAEAVCVAGDEVSGLRRLFSFFHLEPDAIYRRRLLRQPAPVEPTQSVPAPFDLKEYAWKEAHPVIDLKTRKRLRACARDAEARVAGEAAP